MEILEQVKVISEYEFNKLIEKAWPGKAPFDSQDYFELANGSEYLCRNMTGQRDRATQNVEDWVAGTMSNTWITVWAILQCLISKGYASPGHYIIEVTA